jgi:hypothetical protein
MSEAGESSAWQSPNIWAFSRMTSEVNKRVSEIIHGFKGPRSLTFEGLTETSEAFIYVAMSRLMVKSLARS